MLSIAITNQQQDLRLDQRRLKRAVRLVLRDAGFAHARISIAIVDDATIARLNEEFLAHEGPTDVISFVLEESDGGLEGEIVASAATALRVAPEYGWPAEHELLLYVIHGALHLAGYDDRNARQRAAMRAQERAILKQAGVESVPQETPHR